MSGLDDLREVLAAVSIESAARYVLDGVAHEVAGGESALVRDLQDRMYGALYCRWRPAAIAGDELADRELVRRLSEANLGRGTWEPGWRVIGAADEGRLPVRKDGLTLWVGPGQYRCRGGGRAGPAAPPVGTACRVRVAKELVAAMAGYYFAIGDGDERDDDDEDRVVRLYWHIDAAGAPRLIEALTATLNPRHIPFRAKVVNYRGGYPRCDAGVLYVDRRHYPRVAACLPAVHAAVAAHLGDAVPRFTHRLAAGLALAEDPGGDESFGQHRCRLIAGALWSAFAAGATGGDRLAHVCGALAAAGLVPDRLHLQPGSPDVYRALGDAVDATTFAAAPLARRGRRDRPQPRALRARRKQERQWRKANRR